MNDQYLIHLPDGTEYGPVDHAALLTWRAEGRLPEGTLVWPDGAPEWLSVEEALAPQLVVAPGPAPVAAAEPRPHSPRPAAAPLPDSERPDTRPAAPAPKAERPQAHSPHPPHVPHAQPPRGPAGSPRLLFAAGGVLVLLAGLVALWVLARPWLEKRRAIAAVERHATADRRVEDREAGLVVALPPGWLALRKDSPLVEAPQARVALAQPTLGAFATVTVAPLPRVMDALDAHLDDWLQARLPRQPSTKEDSRADVQLGKGQGRLVRTSWDDGLEPMQGAVVAWADGYDVFSLEAWAPVKAGAAFASELDALCRGVTPTGLVEARLQEAVERLSLEVPELSKDALRLLVAERMSQGQSLDDVPAAALRAVSRGLDALVPREANEMRAIYQQVYAPLPEAQRPALAALLAEIKAGHPVPPADVLALREALKTGVLALPAESRSRLQELSGRAIRKSLLLP